LPVQGDAMTHRKLIPLVAFAACLASAAASAEPYLIGYDNRGSTGGQHYYELYFNVDPGYVCGDGPGTEIVTIVLTYLPNAAYESYIGPSGYSKYVCQINVYAPTGSGYHGLSFIWGLDSYFQGFLPETLGLTF
jgi:hypothetical protein